VWVAVGLRIIRPRRKRIVCLYGEMYNIWRVEITYIRR